MSVRSDGAEAAFGALETRLRKMIKPLRLQHSGFVSETAGILAERYGADARKARLAGLLHDYARDLSDQELLALADKLGIHVNPVERELPVLLHGPVGAGLVRAELGIKEEDVLRAIAVHTTAAPGMTALDKIIYLADLIEPLRDYEGVQAIRDLAEIDLDAAVLRGLDASLRYCLSRGSLIHPATVEARNELLAAN